MEKQKSDCSPIKDKNKIKEIASYLNEKNPKYYMMFTLGIQTGMYVNEVLNLKVRDVKLMEWEQLHGDIKKHRAYLGNEVLDIIWTYVKDQNLSDDDYLIPSQKKDKDGATRPLGRTMAFRVLQEAGREYGIDNLGTQTLRRTYGYHYYEQTKDILGLMKVFGSNSLENTLRFIGVEQEEYLAEKNVYFDMMLV